MSQVHFYILAASISPERFACEVAAQFWPQRNPLYIHTKSPEHAAKIDDLLWTFRDISFVPHSLVDHQAAATPPVVIGIDGPGVASVKTSINLSDDIPECFANCEHIIEIIDDDEHHRQLGRDRYRQYQKQHYAIYHHKAASYNNIAQ